MIPNRPGPSSTSVLRRALAAGVLLVALAAACTGDAGPPAGPGTSAPTAPGSAGPSGPPAFELDVDLREVSADGVGGSLRPRDVREPASAVVRTMTDLYSLGFVDPAAWAGGEFPALLPLFAGVARERAVDDVQRLTLGRAAERLDAVRPRVARLDVRFLTDAQRRAVLAVADMRFRGVGLDGPDRRPIRHDGSYTLRKVNGRWRIVAYEVAARTIGPRAEAAFAPGFPSLDPTFVLVIGSDARPGGSVSSTRADSLHIVGVNPRRGRASVLGIPRDSWVAIPGGGTDKINAALVRGGPEMLVQTVERLSGISIDAYVLTGFEGFQAIVKAIGGIDIRIPDPIVDAAAHARLDEGRQHLSARQTLAFSRARHALPNGDFGRSLNQGRVLIATLAALRETYRSGGAAALFPWALAGAEHLRTDLSLTDIFDLLVAAPAFEPRRVRNEVAVGRTGTIAGKSVVILGPGAYAQFRDLGRDGLLGG